MKKDFYFKPHAPSSVQMNIVQQTKDNYEVVVLFQDSVYLYSIHVHTHHSHSKSAKISYLSVNSGNVFSSSISFVCLFVLCVIITRPFFSSRLSY